MNERIKQLESRAWGQVNRTNGLVRTEDFNKKFAELIVRECIKELRYTVVDTQECRQDKSTDYQVGWEDGMFDAGETIKQHFRVE